jgi:hypothetical protein
MAFERVTYLTLKDWFGHGVVYDDLDETIQHDLKSAQAFIPLDITTMRIVATNAIQNLAAHGGILASDSTPTLTRVNGATDRALRVTWAATVVNETQFKPTPWPPDLNADADVIVHLMMARNGTADNCLIDVLAYENGAGAWGADAEFGDKTAALTSAANLVVEATVTLGAGNIAGHPGMLNLSLLPDAHGTDAIYLYAAWIEYTRALRTS